jgi:HAD superfamily hydrolase (TIGR01484 family)
LKKLIVFDLDGTLAESKSALDAEMAALLAALLQVAKVAVISGGDWPQFEKQLVSNLPQGQRMENLLLLPTCGTKFYQYSGQWKRLYAEEFTPDEKENIIVSLSQSLVKAGFKPEQTWGEIIEDRGSQITFSALGQQAPLSAKEKWDPDYAKRTKIKAILESYIPEFSVRMGGTTSIDVTKPGIDKAYGIKKLIEVLAVTKKDVLFVGDRLGTDGNDHPVKAMGVDCLGVSRWQDTALVIQTILGVT